MEDYVYEDDDTRNAEKITAAYAALVQLGDLGLYTPALCNANMKTYDDVYAMIDSLREDDDKQELRRTFIEVKMANHVAPLPDVSDETYQRSCDDGSMPAVNGEKGPLRLAVRDKHNTLVCKSYGLRELGQHIANEGWTDPETHRPFQPFHVDRIKAAFAAVHCCFTYEEPHVMPLHTFGVVTVVSNASVKQGTVGVSVEIYEELLKSDVNPYVMQLAGPNSAVFCTPEPMGYTTAVQLNPLDYSALGDDDFELLLVRLPTAKSVLLSDPTVQLDLFMEAFDKSGSTLLRVGDTYDVMGTEVCIMGMKPSSATARPAVGQLLELDVDILQDPEPEPAPEPASKPEPEPEPEPVTGHNAEVQTEAARAFLERRKKPKV